MVILHQSFISLLLKKEPVDDIYPRLIGFLKIFEHLIKARFFTKIELDTAIKEVIQAIEIWELKHPEEAEEFNTYEFSFDQIKAMYENLLEIEWTQKKQRALFSP